MIKRFRGFFLFFFFIIIAQNTQASLWSWCHGVVVQYKATFSFAAGIAVGAWYMRYHSECFKRMKFEVDRAIGRLEHIKQNCDCDTWRFALENLTQKYNRLERGYKKLHKKFKGLEIRSRLVNNKQSMWDPKNNALLDEAHKILHISSCNRELALNLQK